MALLANRYIDMSEDENKVEGDPVEDTGTESTTESTPEEAKPEGEATPSEGEGKQAA